MDVLLLLIALTAITGVLLVPALRRRRQVQEAMRGAVEATSGGGPYDFTPPEELDVRLPGPDPHLVDALEEAQRDQDWRPVSRLLALTDDWELRWQRVQSLAGAAAMELTSARQGEPGDGTTKDRGTAATRHTGEPGVRDARWLRAWRMERPEDPGGAEVYAQFLVWQAMADPASDFHRIMLEEARKVCHEALTHTSEEDPVPYITELLVARGLGEDPEEFRALWGRLTARAPHHMGAHLAALPYWSASGRGSRDEAYAFAEAAAGSAPEGSLLPALPLFAVYDHLPDANLVRGLYQSAVVAQAIQGAQYAVHHAPADHAVLPHVRHLLLCFLVRAERYAEALEQVRAVDGYVGAVPWVDAEDDARAEYAAYRALAVAGYEGQGGSPAASAPPNA